MASRNSVHAAGETPEEHGTHIAYVEKETKRVDVWQYKPYVCKVKTLDISTGKKIVVLNAQEAEEHDIYSGYRTGLKFRSKSSVAIVDLSKELVKPGEIGVFRDLTEELRLKDGDPIEIIHLNRPASIQHIHEKLDGNTLNEKEIFTIVQDIMEGRLSEVEIAAWVSAAYIRGFSDEEVIALTHATMASGEKLDLGVKNKPILDKHCIPADTPTMVRNSGNVKVEDIGDIVDKIFDRSSPDDIQTNGTSQFATKNLNNLEALTFDNKGNLKFVPVSAVYRLPSPEHLYELQLIGNRTIQATENHTIFTLRKGKIIAVPIQELTGNDHVLVPTGFDSRTIENIKIDTDFGIRNYKKFNNKIAIRPEFMRFIGYYLSEGFTNYQGVFLNFGSHEKELIDDAMACIRTTFGLEPTLNKPHPTAVRVCLYNQTLAKIFEHSLRFITGAKNKRIPSFIFDVSKEMQLEFLRALFKGDGYVRRGYEAIYVTVSKKLATDLQYLLSSLGASVSLSHRPPSQRVFTQRDGSTYTSNTRAVYFIYTQARALFGGRQKANVSYINLLPISELGTIETDKIGWVMRKHLKEIRYMTKQKLARILNYIQSPDVRNIIQGKLGVLKVKNLKKVKSRSKYIYDFRVDGCHRFVAGSAPICIHNSIGGVAGNRTTMLIVPIIAANKLHIPKTSSRSITSASGTADTMQVLCDVSFTMDELRHIVRKSYGAIVWGGGLNLAPVDDRLIRIRHPLNLDPEGMLLASILGKKKSVGATHVIIDIPVGRGAKVPYKEKADILAKHFLKIGKSIGMDVEALITDGAEPIGNGVGPALECYDILRVLEGKGPEDLRHKSCVMAGKLLELSGASKIGEGYGIAARTLESGKALAKIKEIIELQGGDPKVKSSDVPLGAHVYDVKSDVGGQIFHIDNKSINKIARIAGAPFDKGAGVYLYRVRGDRIQKGDKLFTIYAESAQKLSFAIKAMEHLEAVEMRKMLLGTMR